MGQSAGKAHLSPMRCRNSSLARPSQHPWRKASRWLPGTWFLGELLCGLCSRVDHQLHSLSSAASYESYPNPSSSRTCLSCLQPFVGTPLVGAPTVGTISTISDVVIFAFIPWQGSPWGQGPPLGCRRAQTRCLLGIMDLPDNRRKKVSKVPQLSSV